ncbi:hypothetical protein DM860_000973 [Cuscuta australis]|uniref:Replication protein A 70 kDa DNA-binding subunit B/D first OB fold domain-containing protein n=1 Tax=Cuscuta australis TaxID=267555 RepID=A0A328DX25_9ASTE|nr:hypothetical protein DM860_000973 [Cuscuta australis]
MGEGGDSMEIVFHDEHGTRIHAHLAREEKEKFETQIIEGGVYAIRNVFVHDNYQRLKTASNDKLLGFFKRTEVKTLNRNNFPRMMFDLKPFPILQRQPCLNDQLLIDVIGKIVARTKIQTNLIRGREQKFMYVLRRIYTNIYIFYNYNIATHVENGTSTSFKDKSRSLHMESNIYNPSPLSNLTNVTLCTPFDRFSSPSSSSFNASNALYNHCNLSLPQSCITQKKNW